jgi:hypothetical protein
MNRIKKFLFCLGYCVGMIPLVWLFPLATPAAERYYKFVDKEGTVHYTDRYEAIPPAYRERIQIVKEMPVATSPPSAVTEKKDGERGGEEKSPGRLGTDPQKAQEEARREAEEKKFKEELEKEKRVEELRKEIDAKVQEQKGLRTNWMVFDRIRTNQLNQEIDGLQKEIKSIRGEKTEE